MKKLVSQSFPIILTVIITSSFWFLALVDGSVSLLETYISIKTKSTTMTDKRNNLKLETEILELQVKKRFYKAQLQYLEEQGF